jgi:hypothetical protein
MAGDPAKEEPPLKISSEWVQICIANAERLLADSEKVSGPTSIALSELALEEALKAVVLLYHCTEGPTWAESRKQPGWLPPEILEFVRKSVPAVKAIDPRSVFENHRPKLDALNLVAGVIRLSIARFPKEAIAEGSPRVFGPSITLGGLITDPAIAQMALVFSMVDENQARFLTQLKERGFYVNLTDEDHLLSPSATPLPDARLFRVYVGGILMWVRGAALPATGALS